MELKGDMKDDCLLSVRGMSCACSAAVKSCVKSQLSKNHFPNPLLPSSSINDLSLFYQHTARTGWTADLTPSTPASNWLILCWSNPTMSSLLPAKMWTMSASKYHRLFCWTFHSSLLFSVCSSPRLGQSL